MQTDNRMADDLAKVAASAAGVIAGVKDEVEGRLRQVFERMLDDMELVNRDEFEAVKAMAAQARAENERLTARITALESAGAVTPKPRKRPAKATRKT
jgi:BMFP domain-containing protein YqiC